MGQVGRVGKTLVIGAAAVLLLTIGLKADEVTLLDAVKRGDVAAVRALLRAKTDANMARCRWHVGAALGGAA